MLKKQLSIKEIYDSYIQKLNKQKSAIRYSDRTWFHSSSAGLCTRKHFFSSVSQAEGEPIKDDTMRLFRLGDIVHEDIQNAVRDYADANALPILIEKELYLDDFNVRGFIDLALLDRNTLYDIKTCNSWKWSKMFGRGASGMPDLHQQLQLATYGIWVREEYDIQDLKLVMVYYNKNTSAIREVELMSDEMMAEAELYWVKVNDMLEPIHWGEVSDLDERGIDIDMDNHFVTDIPSMGQAIFQIPPIELGTSPVQEWECNYCQFADSCGGIKNAK